MSEPNSNLPVSVPDQVLYVLEARMQKDHKWAEAPVESYAAVFQRNASYLTFCENNWHYPNITKGAFRLLQNKASLLHNIASIQQDEGSLFQSQNKIRNYTVYTVPAQPYALLSLDRVEEAVDRIAAANGKIAPLLRQGFAQLFIGRSYDERGANHVGNELNLRELAAILGDGVAAAVAGPNWESIADQRFLKCLDRDVKPLMKIIADAIPDNKLAACLRWQESQRYDYLRPVVMNNWNVFADEYDGFLDTKNFSASGGRPYIVTDRYLQLRQYQGPLSDLVSEWKASGEVDAVTRMENMGDFGRRFSETFMRLRAEQDEMQAQSDGSTLWITAGGWRKDDKALPPARRFPALGF